MSTPPEPKRPPRLAVQGLVKRYAGVAALDGLALDVDAGECVAFLGHNGSGKTTALWTIAGRQDPSEGKVFVDGRDVHRRHNAAEVRSKVAFVPDAPALYDDLTVLDHLQLVAYAHGVDDPDARVEDLLDRLGLASRQHLLPRELSRGLRQKTQLACTLIRPFRLLLLDEPVVGLDPPSQEMLHETLLAAKRDGAAVVFSTHQLAFARGLADRAVLLTDGAVVASGPYDEVVESADVRRMRFE